ncbi:MAG: response regulator transcription factor, partial [Clostridia bacterium]|nr:response regulator transcription factor [Clostridia bacterium]
YNFEGETAQVIDVYVQHLRKKLGLKNRIKAVYGVGYRFEL